MKSIGEILRVHREQRGQEVEEIAQKLCVQSRYVRAMERDELDALPALFFYRNWVRQYAELVGIDPKILAPLMEPLLPAPEVSAPPTTRPRLAALSLLFS